MSVVDEKVSHWTPRGSLVGREGPHREIDLDDVGRPVWHDWARHLDARQAPPPLRKLFPDANVPPTMWCVAHHIDGDTAKLLRRLNNRKRRGGGKGDWAHRTSEWLANVDFRIGSLSHAVSAVAWADALPRLAPVLDASAWWQLADWLCSVCEDAQRGDRCDVTLTQLLAGELGITLAYQLPELPRCHRLSKPGWRCITDAIIELTDGEGVIHATSFKSTRILFAAWLRSATIARRAKLGKLTRDERDQLVWGLRQMLRFSRADGSAIFDEVQGKDPGFSDVVATALQTWPDNENRLLADCILPTSKTRRAKALRSDVPEAGERSEWAEVALLQTNFEEITPSCGVIYANGRIDCELRNDGKLLWSGDMTPSLRIDGKEIKPSGTWDEVCWLSDEDVDYLELEISFGSSWRLQRQLMLAHDDEFLYVADAILGDSESEIEHRIPIPLIDGITLHGNGETNEACLQKGNSKLGWILPLGLPEWTSATRNGQFDLTSHTLTHHARGTALYAPWFVDLAPSRRRKKKLTFRRLTVGEELQIVKHDVAVGFRVQVGSDQWLFYRSLGEATSRTVLGQNLANEFLAARFDIDGELEELIEIESS